MIPVIPVIKRSREKKAEDSVRVGQMASTAANDARRFVNGVSAAAALLVLAAGVAVGVILGDTLPTDEAKGLYFVAVALAGLFVMFAIKVANQWEKAVVLRFGNFRGLRGPGLFWIVPVVDIVSHLVDQRVRVDRRHRRVGADPRHRAGQRRRHRLLDGVGRGEVDPRGAVVLRRDLPRRRRPPCARRSAATTWRR